jgi:hypothetical protein
MQPIRFNGRNWDQRFSMRRTRIWARPGHRD